MEKKIIFDKKYDDIRAFDGNKAIWYRIHHNVELVCRHNLVGTYLVAETLFPQLGGKLCSVT